MKHSVRSTLVTLGLGVLLQRILQLATFLCVGKALGVERLGTYAEGLGLAALLAVLAGTGVRNVLARAIAQEPAAAGTLVRAAVRARLLLGTALLVPAIAITFATAPQPWFWTLCLLQVLPTAFDLKNLLDATGRTGREVLLETSAAVLQLLLVAIWLLAGGQALEPLAAIALASRCLYAAGALPAIARLPQTPSLRPWHGLLRRSFTVSLGQTAHELMAAGDVWLVAVLFGQGAAGLYAVAIRLSTAALVPSAQLARLLLPHLLRATAAGDPQRTVRTALRATAFATLPMMAGGAVVAEGLCGLFGADFTFAAPALRIVLLALCLQHLGWQCSHALFAQGRDTAYAAGLWWPALVHALLLGTFAALGDAASAALAMLLAQVAYLGAGLALLRRSLAGTPWSFWIGPLATAAATAATAAVPGLALEGRLGLIAQLIAGGLGFGLALWLVELRGRVRTLGDGLAAASGFRG
ncbi:MAG: oligosaccharide flippase family protein [Planctomycetes bacterium]|nr:oligosaccharide flippase family protein [Planctomycetota bacterium]